MHVALAGLVGFVSCMLASAALYPGGTWMDAKRPGYSFWYNFWCDQVSPVALNGAPNALGSWLARLGFLLFALSLWRFWPMAGALSGGGSRARAARILGGAGALALLAAAAVPSTASQWVHAVFVALATLSSLAAAMLLIPSLSRRTDGWTRILGAAVALSAAVCLFQYLWQGLYPAHYATWLPGGQKIVTLLMVLWMLRLWQLQRDADY